MPRIIKTDSANDNKRAIVFSDEEGNSYCNLCDALLFEKRDGSMICSNGYCAKTYSAESVKKHRTKLGPMNSFLILTVAGLAVSFGSGKHKAAKRVDDFCH